MPIISLIVPSEAEGERIDKYLTSSLDGLSRSYIQKQIADNRLYVNEKPVKSSYKVCTDDNVSFDIPASQVPDIEPENIPIDIVYEDSDVCIVNKPQGMVVHPAPGHLQGTLVNALLYHLDGRLSGINGVLRPGIVHRIDKDTSGLLIICKNDIAHASIAEQLKDHSCRREYHAIVNGIIDEDVLTVDAPIGRALNDRLKMAVVPNGKPAITHLEVIERFNKYTYVKLKLETGRTHQIRVHMKHIGHPVMGDPLYNPIKPSIKLNGQVLHAKTIGFKSPTDGEFKLFDSELPDYFIKALDHARNS